LSRRLLDAANFALGHMVGRRRSLVRSNRRLPTPHRAAPGRRNRRGECGSSWLARWGGFVVGALPRVREGQTMTHSRAIGNCDGRQFVGVAS